MTAFKYQAINQSGRVIRGRIDASSFEDMEQRVSGLGLDLVNAKEVRARPGAGLFQPRITRDDLAQFCFYTERLVASGVPLLEGIADVRDSIANPSLRNVLGTVIQDIETGASLSQALRKHPKIFDEVFVSLTEAGEESGELDKVLRSIGDSIRWQDDVIRKIKKMLRYPMIAFVVIILCTGLPMNLVVPGMVKILEQLGSELPFYTEWLIVTSDFFVEQWQVVLIIFVGAWFGAAAAVRTIPGVRYFVDRTSIRLPVVGDIKEKLLFSRFTSVFGLLYGAGVSVVDGLKIAKGSLGNVYISQGLDDVIDSIATGTTIADSFRQSGFFPPLVLRMVRLGEATGGLDQAMFQIKGYYDRDANEAIETAQGVIPGFTLVCLAALLVWIVIAVYGPLYDALTQVT